MMDRLFPAGVVTVSTRASGWTEPPYAAEGEAVANAVVGRRHEYAAGRVCAREALGKLGVLDFPLLSDADGLPIWPTGFVGSISHCPGYCGVAVSPRGWIRSIGFDVEENLPLPAELRAHVVCEEEQDWISQHTSDQALDWHKLLFSAKESAFKAIYPLFRRSFDFWDLELELSASTRSFSLRPSSLCGLAGDSLSGRFYVTAQHIFTGVTVAHRAGDRADQGRASSSERQNLAV